MNYKVVQWAMYEAPMLRTATGRPDVTARHVLQAMAEPAKEDGSDSFLSIPKIEFMTGYDRRTIQRAQRRLEDSGLIVDTKCVRYGCVVWKLAVWLRRPESDWQAIEAQTEQSKAAAAARQRRSRAKRVTHSEDVTEGDVTHSECARHAFEVRDVTHSECARHALSAAVTRREPPQEPEENQTPPSGFGPESSDLSKKAAAHPSLRSGRLPSEPVVDHLPPEDTPPVAGTATIPGVSDLSARLELSELGERCEAALEGQLPPEAVELLVLEVDRAKRHHMQGCGRCQRRTSPCPAVAPLVAWWAQLGASGPRGATAPF